MDNTQQAKDTFNKTWDYIDMENRTREDDLMMIHLAHTSCYLWSTCGTQLNVARGEWQISKVYSILKMGESAKVHAQRYLDLCEEHNFEAFDFAFAYESLARACKVLNEDYKVYVEKALKYANMIDKDSDKEYTISEIENI